MEFVSKFHCKKFINAQTGKKIFKYIVFFSNAHREDFPNCLESDPRYIIADRTKSDLGEFVSALYKRSRFNKNDDGEF